jgi:hypothetical protein
MPAKSDAWLAAGAVVVCAPAGNGERANKGSRARIWGRRMRYLSGAKVAIQGRIRHVSPSIGMEDTWKNHLKIVIIFYIR